MSMRRYEVVFVLAPTLEDEEVEKQVETYVNVATEMGAEIVEVDKWGKRRLAFPVQRHNEGYYTVITLNESAGETVAELERRFKVSDAVIRFLSVRVDLEIQRTEKFEKRRDLRKKRPRGREKSEPVADKE
jgi:small subunit ribosomal protein S6